MHIMYVYIYVYISYPPLSPTMGDPGKYYQRRKWSRRWRHSKRFTRVREGVRNALGASAHEGHTPPSYLLVHTHTMTTMTGFRRLGGAGRRGTVGEENWLSLWEEIKGLLSRGLTASDSLFTCFTKQCHASLHVTCTASWWPDCDLDLD